MLIQGVRDFSIHGALTDCVVIEAKKTASTNRADGSCGNHNLRGLAPSLYMAKIEHEQLEHLNTVNKIGGLSKIVRFSHSTII